jgi:hypothetical protein
MTWTPRYFDADGRPTMSVTEILSRVGLRTLPPCSAEELKYAGRRGTAVHQATAILDGCYPGMSAEDRKYMAAPFLEDPPEVSDYVACWEEFKRRERFVSHRMEFRLVVDLGWGKYGMTLDREGLWRAKTPAILDIKSGVYEEWWKYQLAGYELGMKTVFRQPVHHPYRWVRISVELRPGEKIPYRMRVYEGPTDESVFKSALVVALAMERDHPSAEMAKEPF